MVMDKRYNYREVEPKWQRKWEEWQIYRFDRSDVKRPAYSINTPPPYPSGEFHVGNALNHAYIDFAARYKRMRGYNVLFPQGWDCHGLPTEVRVERTVGKTKREIPEEEFLRLCREYTLQWIKPMKEAIKRLGCSIDWSTEYRTMDPDYWRRTQLSFVEMYRKGFVYRGEHPVFWCPRCETAIAEAEVEYKDTSRKLYYYYFMLENGDKVPVASTRPELLGACVALVVNPEDQRYKSIVGMSAYVPIYNRKIKILSDSEVDPNFGTGVVMVCTYGDKTDVRWQKRYNLPIIKLINERGLLTDEAGPLKGMKINEARKKIIELLKERRLYIKEEVIQSSVGTCWRCHTPVEILPKKQWFVKTMALREKVLEEALKIKWIPEHARLILENWVKGLDWDWTISRQRLFATPIPAWYCEKCG
ncbi:MAG: valine--tRNA ligase, partial [Thermoprotei archaeon]